LEEGERNALPALDLGNLVAMKQSGLPALELLRSVRKDTRWEMRLVEVYD